MSLSRPSYAPLSFLLSLVLVALGAVAALGAGEEPDPSSISTAGVTPVVMEGSSPGGNVTCQEVDPSFTGDSGRADYSIGGGFGDYEWPDWLTVAVTDDTSVSWAVSEDANPVSIAAVIVKGGPAANVYLYDPAGLTGDSGLVSPVNASGTPAELSNLTLCWDPTPPSNGNGDDNGDDNGNGVTPVTLTCEQAAIDLDLAQFSRTAGPILIAQGIVVEDSLPVGVSAAVEGDTDEATFEVLFSADFMVELVIVTASPSTPFVVSPASTSGSVTLEDNPSELMLCGNAVSATDPEPVVDPSPTDPSGGSAVTPSSTPEQPTAETLDDPIVIPTGGGPSGRTPLTLLSLVILSMIGSTSMLLWSRGAGV